MQLVDSNSSVTLFYFMLLNCCQFPVQHTTLDVCSGAKRQVAIANQHEWMGWTCFCGCSLHAFHGHICRIMAGTRLHHQLHPELCLVSAAVQSCLQLASVQS